MRCAIGPLFAFGALASVSCSEGGSSAGRPPVDAAIDADSAALDSTHAFDVSSSDGDVRGDGSADSGPTLGRLCWSESAVVLCANLDGTTVTTIVTVVSPNAIAIDDVNRKIYWCDSATDTITRANQDGSGKEVLYKGADGFTNPLGLAIDVAANRMFWTEAGAVRSAKLDGSDARVVVTTKFPTAVAVDPSAKKIYWTDNDADTVSRGSYDGTAIEVLYTNKDAFSNPSAVAVDATSGKVFWTESGAVRSSNLDGTAVATVAISPYPTGVALDPSSGLLYVSDNGSDTITRMKIDGTSATVLYTSSVVTANPRFVVVHSSVPRRSPRAAGSYQLR